MNWVSSYLKSSMVEKIALILIFFQLIIKITLEIRKSFEATMAIVPVVAIMLTFVWIGIILACLFRKKSGYLWGGIIGILHIIIAIPLPFMGICNHYFMAVFVATQGFLISVFSFLAYRNLAKQQLN